MTTLLYLLIPLPGNYSDPSHNPSTTKLKHNNEIISIDDFWLILEITRGTQTQDKEDQTKVSELSDLKE